MVRSLHFFNDPTGRRRRRREQERDRLVGYDNELEAREAIQIIQSHTMLPYPRLVTLYQQAVFCERHDLPGSFVECGTWKGGATGLMALASLKHGAQPRPIHLFDSFEGIPEPDERVDGVEALRFARAAGGGASGKLTPLQNTYAGVGTLEVNQELMEHTIGYPSELLHYHKGWFQDTLPRDAASVGPIALLRLDGDWYASTKVCLEHLYEQVIPGGFVVVDDYGCYEGCRTAVDGFLQSRRMAAFLHHIDSEGRYWIKPS